MLFLQESRDPSLILSFMKGKGIVRRCSGGYDTSGVDLEKAIIASDASFLIACEDEKKWGFMVLNKLGEFHLCLKTIGSKTRDFFRLLIEEARSRGIKALNAAYPKSNRGADRLLREFGFIDSGIIHETPAPYYFKTLSI